MESINKLEQTVAGWLKSLPHLPDKARKWIATNIWWLEVICLIIMVFVGLSLIYLLMIAFGISAAVTTAYGVPITYTGLTVFLTILSLGLMFVSIAIMAMAINPLKSLKKRGWDLLFIVLLINCASSLISAIFSFSFSLLISSAVGIFISAYLLFEIRSYFVAVKNIKSKK